MWSLPKRMATLSCVLLHLKPSKGSFPLVASFNYYMACFNHYINILYCIY